jgi:hypothetical protein
LFHIREEGAVPRVESCPELARLLLTIPFVDVAVSNLEFQGNINIDFFIFSPRSPRGLNSKVIPL